MGFTLRRRLWILLEGIVSVERLPLASLLRQTGYDPDRSLAPAG